MSIIELGIQSNKNKDIVDLNPFKTSSKIEKISKIINNKNLSKII